MPPAKEYISTQNYGSTAYRAQRELAEKEFRERREISKRNWAYYEGRHRRFLKKTRDGFDDNIIMNLCKQNINRRVAFLFPSMPTIDLVKDQDVDDEKWLNDVWAKNGGAILARNMTINGAIDGQCYVRIVPGDVPSIIPLFGGNIIAWWQEDLFTKVLWWELQWESGGARYRQDVVRDGAFWLVRDFTMNGSRWQLTAEERWLYELSPIVSWQHLPDPKDYYGFTELENAGINDAVNLVASNINRIIRLHGHPRTVIKGLTPPQKTPQRDGSGNIVQGKANPEISSSPQDAYYLPKDGDAYNLEMQSDLTAAMGFLTMLRDHFRDENNIMVMPGDVKAFNGVSNQGIQAAFLPMLNTNETLQSQYGTKGIIEISKRLLMLGGKAWQEYEPMLKWQSALPVNEQEVVDVQRQELEMGTLSQMSAMEARGRDPERERARMMDDAEFAFEQRERQMLAPEIF